MITKSKNNMLKCCCSAFQHNKSHRKHKIQHGRKIFVFCFANSRTTEFISYSSSYLSGLFLITKTEIKCKFSLFALAEREMGKGNAISMYLFSSLNSLWVALQYFECSFFKLTLCLFVKECIQKYPVSLHKKRIEFVISISCC